MARTLPIRIVHLIDSLGVGGAERLLLTTVKHLDPTRFRSHVVALGSPLDLGPAIESVGVSVECLDASSPRRWPLAILRLTRVLRRTRADVLHTHLRFSNLLGRVAAVLARTPVVLTSLHHVDLTYWPPTHPLGRIFSVFDRLSAQRVNTAFVAVSNAVRADYERHFRLCRVQVIHNYLEPETFAGTRAKHAEARRRLGFCEEDLVLLNVARLAPEKGQRYLVDALATIRQKVPTAQLVVLGGGPEQAALERRADELGVRTAVHFPGRVLDVEPFLAAADVFVFPSLGEGFGIALAEAMAAELAVVTTDVDGLAELVQDGVDGLIVPPRDAAAIADAVLRLADDAGLRSRLAGRARHTAVARFSTEVALPRIEALYEESLARRRAEAVRA